MVITLTVKEIMKTPIISVDITKTVREAAERMVEHDIGSIIVTNKEEPVGIVTERDLLKKVTSKGMAPLEVKVSDVMNSPLITVDSKTTIGEATLQMHAKKVRRLLVTEKGKIVGIICQRDLQEAATNVFLTLSSM